MSSKLKIVNGKIITPTSILLGATLVVQDGKVADIVEGECNVDALEIDAHGKYVSPGFIDLHVHGGGGYDFMDGTVDAFLKVAEAHMQYGTTSMLPTTLTSDKESMLQSLVLYEEAAKINSKGAQFLGMHLEGPYFSMHQRGAQDARYIRTPDENEYMDIVNRSSSIKRWSIAPELPGSIKMGSYLRSKNILPSIGHTDAVYDEVVEAFDNGFSLITHFYSCMSGVTRRNGYRYAGVIESGYLIDDMAVEIIADGIHLPPPLLKLVYKIKGPDKIALVTDAMRAAGMPPGESILGSKHDGIRVIVEDGVAKLPGGDSFAGSIATANQLIRTMVQTADVSLHAAVKMMTSTPAQIIKVDHQKGSLVKGKDADIVIFDDDVNIDAVIIKGKVMQSAKSLMIL